MLDSSLRSNLPASRALLRPSAVAALLLLGVGGALALEPGAPSEQGAGPDAGAPVASPAQPVDGGDAEVGGRPPRASPEPAGGGPGAAVAPTARLEATAEPDLALERLEESESGHAFAPAAARAPSLAALASLPAAADYLARAREEDGILSVEVDGARRALTINPALQRRATELLRTYQVPYGALAAVEPATGRVLALAEYSAEAPRLRGLALRAVYPAASVFKVVSGAALLSAGVSPEERVCYHGGKRRVSEKLLRDDARLDGRCLTLKRAMGQSANVIFAKLARRALDAPTLERAAAQLGFNAPIPFDEPLEVSSARIPADELGLATTAAGFGEVFLSPLHGALLAAAVGRRGLWSDPVLFEGEPSRSRRALDEGLAGELSDMMETCVAEGTARRAFREGGRYALPVPAAGKTGSLANKVPFRDFSWFVGFAPKDDPRIAVAAVIVNGPKWRVRAPYVVREAMRAFLEPPRPRPAAHKPMHASSRR